MRKVWLAIIIIAGIALAALALLFLSGRLQPRAEVRFRVDATVSDHGVLRRGSTVWSMTLVKPLVALASPYSSKFQGDAIAIPAGGRRLVLVLPLPEPGMLPESVLSPFVGGRRGDRIDLLKRIAARPGLSVTRTCSLDGPITGVIPRSGGVLAEATPNVCLEMAALENPADPMSLQATGRKNNRYLYVKKLKITVVKEAVYRNLEKNIPWISNNIIIKSIYDNLRIDQKKRDAFQNLRRD